MKLRKNFYYKHREAVIVIAGLIVFCIFALNLLLGAIDLIF